MGGRPLACISAALLLAFACRSRAAVETGPPSLATPLPAPPLATLDDPAPIPPAPSALSPQAPPDVNPSASSDPMAGHAATQDELLALLDVHASDPSAEAATQATLRTLFDVKSANTGNQGNRALSLHTISKKQCLEGLKGIELQTPEQKATCGTEGMVPIHKRGEAAKSCIDIFEFPNKPCELPVVWTPPVFAEKVCKMQGKRLCSQDEWQVACRGAPDDAPDRPFAYGDTLDLAICHTSRPHRQRCDVTSSGDAWKSCTTDTEPAGAFPQCRSRFGVFDQHGNVAEIMTRKDPEKGLVTQLKGSAWFYTEVAPQPGRKQETYPDTCNFDPRWHVETLSHGFHVNYHLGFRCCKSL